MFKKVEYNILQIKDISNNKKQIIFSINLFN